MGPQKWTLEKKSYQITYQQIATYLAYRIRQLKIKYL